MESIKDDHVNSKNTYFVKNVTEAQQSERVLNKNTETQLRVNNPPPVYSLHDPYDLHNIHGLRKYYNNLITFNLGSYRHLCVQNCFCAISNIIFIICLNNNVFLTTQTCFAYFKNV